MKRLAIKMLNRNTVQADSDTVSQEIPRCLLLEPVALKLNPCSPLEENTSHPYILYFFKICFCSDLESTLAPPPPPLAHIFPHDIIPSHPIISSS